MPKPTPLIVINDQTQAIFYAELAQKGNILAAVNGDGTATVRFRWYRDEKLGPDSQDERSSYTLTPKVRAPGIDPLLELIEESARTAAIVMGASVAEIFIIKREGKTEREFIEAVQKLPCMHVVEP